MTESDTELVLVEGAGSPETDLLVDSADAAGRAFVEAGGSIVQPAFDLPIGRCVVVRDPWGNSLVVLDISKGPLRTDPAGNVVPEPSTP